MATSNQNLNLLKRYLRLTAHLLFSAGAFMSSACSQAPAKAPPKPLTQEEQLYQQSRERMAAKFGKDFGYDLVVDAMKDQEFWAVKFTHEHSNLYYYGKACQTRETRTTSHGHSIMPERMHIIWRESDKWGKDENGHPIYDAKIIGDEIIDVGNRIPQALIDDLKRDPRGQLRIKFRMSNQGTMLGWDIERRPGYDPEAARRAFNERKEYPYFRPEFSFAGGDFQEAWIVKGQVARKGWYIDKKTGQKIETDY
jgi:hypothetical protein